MLLLIGWVLVCGFVGLLVDVCADALFLGLYLLLLWCAIVFDSFGFV